MSSLPIKWAPSVAIALVMVLGMAIVVGRAQKKQENAADDVKREICITFNELPVARTFEETDLDALTYLVLETLDRHEVAAAGFVVGQNVGTNFDILGEWLNRGHVLGNMTYAHQDLHEIGIEKFISDIEMGHETIEDMLSGFGQKKRYFRFPYLHYGDNTNAKRQVNLYLDHQNYVTAHATVVPEDYLYNLTLEKLGKYPDSAEYDALLNEYVNHVLDEVERCQLLALELVNRPVKQILLLRMNRLNAIYLDEMLRALTDMGYEFVTLDEALADNVYDRPEGYYGGRGVGYLDMLYQSDPDLIPAQ
ncbi:polysaccharide deacetylase family protein [candidate division GN15 bacterium]|nr:polysaccharide deacetylase family protein [candidate division GN15 bacterium]